MVTAWYPLRRNCLRATVRMVRRVSGRPLLRPRRDLFVGMDIEGSARIHQLNRYADFVSIAQCRTSLLQTPTTRHDFTQSRSSNEHSRRYALVFGNSSP